MIKFIYYDFANTLVYKANIHQSIHNICQSNGFNIKLDELVKKHTELVHATQFPDLTTKEFYDSFNSTVLASLNIQATQELLDEIYNTLKKQQWQAFPDLKFIYDINLPRGILSNWDSCLNDYVSTLTDGKFKFIFGSHDTGIAKPNSDFFMKAINATGYKAQEVMMIGDSLRLDIEPALSLGMQAILIDRNSDHKNYSGAKIKSLGELASYL